MKKFLVVMMIAMVSMAGLFATTSTDNTLSLTYGVAQLFTPGYTLSYKVYDVTYDNLQASGTTEGFTAAQNNPTIEVATAQDDFAAGYVEVVVNDNTKYNLSSTKEVTYSIALTQSWKQTVGTATYLGPQVTLVDFAVPSSPTDISIDASADKAFTVTYPTYKVHNSAAVQELGRFAAYWPADTTVEAGTYTAIVTLTVTTP